MDELIARISEKVGIEQQTASTSLAIMLKFLHDECPPELAGRVLEIVPGAREMLAEAPQAEAGIGSFLGGLLGGSTGGMIAAVTSLTNAGLGMSQIQDMTKEVFGYARERAGPDFIQEVLEAIPQLKMMGH